ncbi:MAG: hypothetical protein Q8P62_00590 [Candidatus Peregrinibacteria bacterium]|nr:hypothetical protein [Candidatus Peregrinibacteria bacterium]
MKTEKELHLEFLKLGANRRKLTNELLALLPEIYDRKIYLKYASTIIEYAGKLGGLSKGVVLKRLRLEKYLSDKPKLKEAIKTEGIHKVALVASVATAETEEAWVDKLKNMSKNAIQELSKEVRNKEMEAEKENFGESGLFGDLVQMAGTSAPCKAAPLKITVELTDEMAFMFLKLKKKAEASSGKFFSNKEAMNEILKQLADKEFSEKAVVKTADQVCEKVILEDGFSEEKFQQKISRYIPAHVKKMATLSTHGKCAYPGCGHPAEIFHHRERFAESKNHKSIISLCKIHHEFAHNGIISNESQNSEQWNLNIEENNLFKSDLLYREVRLKALR